MNNVQSMKQNKEIESDKIVAMGDSAMENIQGGIIFGIIGRHFYDKYNKPKGSC